ncbi:MAG: RNA polymerase sigma factor [Cyclobacteriaceae bacterium]|nr:RNA polymerase sigma factor [Cyclobacteriaceae bacterium]
MHAETLLDIAMKHADALIVSAQKGDEKALNSLVGLWYKRIYNYAFKYVSEHDMATEISQKTFIAMFRNIQRLHDVDRFKPWLYRIATNLCHEENRKKKSDKTVSLSIYRNDDKEEYEVAIGEAKGNGYNPERNFQQLELESMLLEALSEINDEHRSVVIMKEYEGFKFREIAEVLDVSENTVKTRLYAGLKNLKTILKRKNITKETVYYEL